MQRIFQPHDRRGEGGRRDGGAFAGGHGNRLGRRENHFRGGGGGGGMSGGGGSWNPGHPPFAAQGSREHRADERPGARFGDARPQQQRQRYRAPNAGHRGPSYSQRHVPNDGGGALVDVHRGPRRGDERDQQYPYPQNELQLVAREDQLLLSDRRPPGDPRPPAAGRPGQGRPERGMPGRGRGPGSQPRPPVCRYFAQGICNRGDKCPFLHDASSQVTAPPQGRTRRDDAVLASRDGKKRKKEIVFSEDAAGAADAVAFMKAETHRQAQLDAPGGFDHASAIAIHEERLAPDGSSFVASFVVDGVGRRLPQGSDPSFHVERDDQEASTLPCSFEGPESRCPFGDNCKYQHPLRDNDRRLAMPRRFEGGMFQVEDERMRAAVERVVDKATRKLEEMERQEMQQQEMKREAFQETVRQRIEDSKPPALGRAARLMQVDREKDLYMDAERRLADYSRDQSSRALQALDQNGNSSTARHGASSTGRRSSESKKENALSESDLQKLALAIANPNSDEVDDILRDCLGELSIERSRRDVFRDVADSGASPNVARLLRGSSIQNADTQDAFIDLLACAPLTPDKGPVRIKLKEMLEGTVQTFTIMMEDIDSSNEPRLDAAVLENEWNNDDEVMGRAMQGELPGDLKDSLNLSNPYSRFMMALFMWRYTPPVTWDCPSWKDKMYELQCCLIMYFQIAPRYLSREYRHEKCRDTFTHLIKGLDLWPFELVKGTEAELNTQIQRYVRLFRLKSKSELALFAVVKLMRHQILHMLQYGEELGVGIASAESSLVVLGESGRDRHLQQRETEMGILCTLFHSQAIWMGMHKSELLCPPNVREALDRNLTLVLSPVIGIQEEENSDFCTEFHGYFGDDPDDEKHPVQLGLLSSLSKRIEAASAWTDPRRLLTDESDKLLFEGQCALHGMETLMERLRHVHASHKMSGLASQWELGQTMPPELLSGIHEVAGVLQKRPQDILKSMHNLKKRNLVNGEHLKETMAGVRNRIANNEGSTDDHALDNRIKEGASNGRETMAKILARVAGDNGSADDLDFVTRLRYHQRCYTPEMEALHSQLTEATADSAGDHTSLMEAIKAELARISTVVGTVKLTGQSDEHKNAASNERVRFTERGCTALGKDPYTRTNWFLVTAKEGENQEEAQRQGHREARVCYDIVADLFLELNRVTICEWLSKVVSREKEDVE